MNQIIQKRNGHRILVIQILRKVDNCGYWNISRAEIDDLEQN